MIPDVSAPSDPAPIPQWQKPATPEALAEEVERLKPRLAYHLHRYGLGSDPLAMGEAKLLAAKALQSYDPNAGTQFNTWLDRGMQPLSRFRRLRSTAVAVPEKIQMDAYRLHRATIDFEEEHGREPELDELADAAGLTLKRLDRIQKSFRKMTGEAAFEGNLPSEQDTDFMSEALEAVWDESDKRDRKILEHRTGFGGKEVIQPKLLAAQLGISPVELSRRSARLGAKLDEILELLEK